MAKKASKEGANKSELTRDYISRNPEASPKEIVEGMKGEGVGISVALASKIKYDPSRKGGKKGGKKGRKKKAARREVVASTSGTFDKGNKAEAIRQAARSIGGKVRPRDVIAMLGEHGIEVSSAQVSTTLKAMGMKRKLRGRKPGAVATAPRAASRSEAISIDDLIAAKKLVEKVGSVEAASQALSALAKLS